MKSDNVPLARQEYIQVGENISLHLTDLGEGKPLVLIHGWSFSDAMYEYQYQYFVDRGVRVIGITLRGFGKSDKPYGKYSYEVFAKDIQQILEKLDLEEVTLGGFSMGGAIALYYAGQIKTRVSKLALFGAAAPIWTRRADFPFNFFKDEVQKFIDLSKTDRPRLYEEFGKLFSGYDLSLSVGMASWLDQMNWEASPYALTQCLIALRDTDLRASFSEIAIPTIILHGRHDRICDFSLAELMHCGIKGSSLVAFEYSGHALFLEETELFNRELEKFIV